MCLVTLDCKASGTEQGLPISPRTEHSRGTQQIIINDGDEAATWNTEQSTANTPLLYVEPGGGCLCFNAPWNQSPGWTGPLGQETLPYWQKRQGDLPPRHVGLRKHWYQPLHSTADRRGAVLRNKDKMWWGIWGHDQLGLQRNPTSRPHCLGKGSRESSPQPGVVPLRSGRTQVRQLNRAWICTALMSGP